MLLLLLLLLQLLLLYRCAVQAAPWRCSFRTAAPDTVSAAHVSCTGLALPCSWAVPYACGAFRSRSCGAHGTARQGRLCVGAPSCTKQPIPMCRTPLTLYNTSLLFYYHADSYGFLPLKLTFASATFGDVSVSSDMAKISPASNNT